MERALPGASVDGYEVLLSTMEMFGKDAHVVAAAVFGRADAIVTSNVRDFADISRLYGLLVQTPDDFLIHQDGLDHQAILEALREQAAATSRPPLTPNDILDRLVNTAPSFVRVVRRSGDFTAA